MKLSPVTSTQWRSVVTNALLAAVAAFSGIVVTAGTLDRATVSAGVTAAIMAIFKITQKLFTEE